MVNLRLVALGALGVLGSVIPAAATFRTFSADPPAAPLPPRPSPVPAAAPAPPPPPPPEPATPLKPLPEAPSGDQIGLAGLEVLDLEERLTAIGYLAGKVDGFFDAATRHGVVAFQKVEGLPVTGRADFLTLSRLPEARRPDPAYDSPPDHLEVDIGRQVILVVRGGRVDAVLPTSTGSNKLFRAQGWTRRAVTPNGTYAVERKIKGWRRSPLGLLYKPSYFNGGIAFHGHPSVPTRPVSHGCVRMPIQFADWFFDHAAPVGMAVHVYGGPYGENPQPAIVDAPASPPPAEPEPASSPEPAPVPLLPLPGASPAPRPTG